MVDGADPLERPDNVIPFPGQPEALTPEQMQELAAQLIDEAGGPQAALAAIAQNAPNGRRPGLQMQSGEFI